MAEGLKASDFLPEFTGGEKCSYESVNTHWLLFEDYLQVHELFDVAEDAEHVKTVSLRFRLSLTGQARLWAQAEKFLSVKDMKDKFFKRFGGNQSELAVIKQFNDMKLSKENNVQEYLQRLRQKAERLGYDERQIKNKLLCSLPQDCQRALVLSAPADADASAIASLAQRYFDINVEKVTTFSDVVMTCREQSPHLRQKARSHSSQERHRSHSSQDRHRMRDRGTRVPGRDSSPSPGRGRGYNQQKPTFRHNKHKTVTCYHCGTTGHFWQECPNVHLPYSPKSNNQNFR